MSRPVIITLDGPAGVGKSTLAKMLASELSLPYLDTGAMFRSLAFNLGPDAADLPAADLGREAANWNFDLAGSGNQTCLLVNGCPVGNEIRTEEVGNAASRLAARPAIRERLRQIQQDLGSRISLVAEGRDLGTVVFPTAAVKFFLDARPEIRARRRWLELGKNSSLEEIEAAIRKRDDQDRNRAIAPLRAASDAILIDTSDLDLPAAAALLAQKSRAALSGKKA